MGQGGKLADPAMKDSKHISGTENGNSTSGRGLSISLAKTRWWERTWFFDNLVVVEYWNSKLQVKARVRSNEKGKLGIGGRKSSAEC